MKEGYLPLYRKYRPQKIDDIVGQTHIKKALSNAIELNKIAHAYLFTGPRGTGKTSTARILAKSLNCVNGPTVTPCEECESCKAITNTVPIDVIEMDAASNRSVDDAREILEKVNYAPVHGKYKIYIIDEVHMLTDAAFNALLKTLEEPPQNVIFILATTEAHKVLPTIISRCQRYDFKRITTNDIIEHLKKIAQKENIKISDGAISVIAKSAAGGMRDSLSLLDQVSNMGSSEEITEDDINSLLGRLSFESLYELVTHIANSDGSSAINVLEKIYNDGNEPIQILTNLLYFIKNLLIVKTCDKNSAETLTNLSSEQIKTLSDLVNNLEKHQIVFLINKVSDYIKEMKQATNQQLWLEVSLIDLSNLTDNTKLADLENRIARLEGGDVQILHSLSSASISSEVIKPHSTEHQISSSDENISKQITQSASAEPPVQIVSQPDTQITSNNSSNLSALWLQVIDVLLGNSDPGGRAKMKGMANIVKYDGNEIVIAVKNQVFASRFNEPERRSKLLNAVSKVIGKSDINLVIREKNSSDLVVQNSQVEQTKKKITPPIDLVEKIEEVSEEEKNTVYTEQNPEITQNNDEQNYKSDLAKSVCTLFDGKYIE